MRAQTSCVPTIGAGPFTEYDFHLLRVAPEKCATLGSAGADRCAKASKPSDTVKTLLETGAVIILGGFDTLAVAAPLGVRRMSAVRRALIPTRAIC